MHPTLALLLAATPLAMAAKTETATPEDEDSGDNVSEILEEFYGTNLPASATGAAATSLAAALFNFEITGLSNDDGYASAADAIYMAAATATDSDDIMSTLDAQGVMNTQLYTTSSWYASDVPASAQSAWNSLIGKMHTIETSALAAAATATGTAVSWAVETGYGITASDGDGTTLSATATHKITSTAAAAATTTAASASSSGAGSSGGSSSSSAASTSQSTAGAMGARPTAAAAAAAGMAAVVAAAAAALC